MDFNIQYQMNYILQILFCVFVKLKCTYKIRIIDIGILHKQTCMSYIQSDPCVLHLLPLKFPDCRTFSSCSCSLSNQPSPSDPADWISARPAGEKKSCWFFMLF